MGCGGGGYRVKQGSLRPREALPSLPARTGRRASGRTLLGDEFEIAVAERADGALAEAVTRLIRQLSSSASPPTPAVTDLAAMIESSSTTLLLARAGDGSVVGMLALVVFPIPTGLRAWIEDAVVDRRVRGQGVGAALTRRALDLALSRGARTVELTSRPERTAANALYRKLGFERRDTNVYRYTPR
jgi:ribosomal protein S18 acetylase RimI-like enzyme